MTGDLPPPARSAPPPSTASVTGTETTSGTDWLRDELALVDEASRALSLGRCDEAEQALARYRERFPSGLLRSEIDVISVEAIGMRGDHDRAAARAQRFLSLHPKSPYAARLSTWLSGHPGIAGARSCIPSP